MVATCPPLATCSRLLQGCRRSFNPCTTLGTDAGKAQPSPSMNGRVEVVRAYHRCWATKNYRAKHAIRVLPSFGKKKKRSNRSREPFAWHTRLLLGGGTRARQGSARPVISVAAGQRYCEISNLSADTRPAPPFGFLLPKHSRPLLPTSPPLGNKLKRQHTRTPHFRLDSQNVAVFKLPPGASVCQHAR